MRTQGWAPTRYPAVPRARFIKKDLKRIKDQIKPGKRMILGKGSVVHTKVDLQGDLEKTLKSVEEATKDIFGPMVCPSLLHFKTNKIEPQPAML